MSDELDPPRRPRPARSPVQRARDWIEWFGVARLAAAAVSVLAVVAGATWLLRAPPAATEALLPSATTTTSGPTSGSTSADAAIGSGAARPATSIPAGASATTVPPVWLVHVAGAVARPGVHALPAGSRVVDAVAAAGGAAPGADLDALNLAAPAADGGRVYVPLEGEEVPAPPAEVAAAGSAPGPTGPVDLNAAGVGELEALPGIGPATAAAIVEHRERHGPFASVDDLDAVSGIGPAKLEAIRDLVRV